MHQNPDQEWRRLSAHYAEKWDDELLNLAADYKDLTDMARQVLRDEMRKRNLADPEAPGKSAKPPRQSFGQEPGRVPGAQSFDEDPQVLRRRYSGLLDRELLHDATHFDDLTLSAQEVLREEMKRRDLGDPTSLASGYDPTDPESIARSEAEIAARLESRRALHGEEERDYTWQTPLCDCESRDEALQRLKMLERAGIQWCFRDPSRNPGDPTSARLDYRILVAADELEDALQVIAQPIPQDIIDDSKVEVPAYEMPRCPRCSSEEPTLVDTVPSNQWLCESCGHEWSEPVPEQKRA